MPFGYTLNNYVSSNNSQRFYRAILLDASMCKYDTTNVFSINVLKKTVRNNASFAPTTTKNDVCSGTTYYLNANMEVALLVYLIKKIDLIK